LADNNSFTNIVNYSGQNFTNVTTANLPASVNFQYDADGNLIFDGVRGFTFDDEDRLASITITNFWKTELLYDGLNRKRIVRESAWIAGAWSTQSETRYIYDGLLVLQERDASNTPLVTYTRGIDFSGTMQGAGGIGGLLARTGTNGSVLYHADGNGNISALVDAQQTLEARYLYDPFGNLLGKWGPLADVNHYRFSSKEWHGVSGIYDFGRRFYQPNLQRWMNADPIGEAGGLNLHRFVGNDPNDLIDPYGLDWASWPVIGPMISNNRLNEYARSQRDAEGNTFRDYRDAMRYFDERTAHFNEANWQAGGEEVVQTLQSAGETAVEGVLNAPMPALKMATVGAAGIAVGERLAKECKDAARLERRAATGPLKNLGGTVDEAANAARSAPYRPDTVSTHALGRMETRGVSAESIQEAVSKGTRTLDPVTGKATYTLGRVFKMVM
jgi:RHS repeat-associated protein